MSVTVKALSVTVRAEERPPVGQPTTVLEEIPSSAESAASVTVRAVSVTVLTNFENFLYRSKVACG